MPGVVTVSAVGSSCAGVLLLGFGLSEQLPEFDLERRWGCCILRIGDWFGYTANDVNDIKSRWMSKWDSTLRHSGFV